MILAKLKREKKAKKRLPKLPKGKADPDEYTRILTALIREEDFRHNPAFLEFVRPTAVPFLPALLPSSNITCSYQFQPG